jgi:hypothetical protein
MSGETDLGRLIKSMKPVVRPGEFVFVSIDGPADPDTLAMVAEEEGRTLVVTRETADLRGWPYDYVGVGSLCESTRRWLPSGSLPL